MPSISSISITINAITAPFIKGIRSAAAVTRKFVSSLKNMTMAILKFTAVGVGALTAALSVLAAKAISAASKFETLTVQFKTLLGSASAARDRMKELAKFAATTPFQLNDIAAASRILQALTKGVLATGEGLRMVGDAAAVANQPIQEIALHIGRIFSGAMSGRAAGMSLMRLTQLGMIAPEVRAKFEDLQKAGEKGSHVWAVIADELSKTNGSMKDLSNTTSGLFSTLKDNLDAVFTSLGRILEPFTKVLLKQGIAGLQKLTKMVEENAEALFKRMLPAIEKILSVFKQVQRAVVALFMGIAKLFNVNTVEQGLDSILKGVQKFFINIEFAIKNLPEIWNLAWQTILLNLEQTMRNVISMILTPFRMVAVAVGEMFFAAFTAVTNAAKDIPKLIALKAQREFAVTSKEVRRINLELKKLEEKRKRVGRDMVANFKLEGFEEAFTQVSGMVDKAFGGSLEGEFIKIEQRWKQLSVKFDKFEKARITGNKAAMKGLFEEIKELADLIFNPIADQTGGLAGVFAGMVEQAQEIKNTMMSIRAPGLAVKGSQAAARGELGILSNGKLMLKELRKGNNILKDIEMNQNQNQEAVKVF